MDKIPIDQNIKIKKNWHNGHLRDQSMRNSIGYNLTEAEPNDWVIISDLDEIPNPKKIINFKPNFKYAFFEQKFLSFKFNILNKSESYWYGSRICVKKFLKSPQWLRDLKFKKRPFWRIDKFRLNNIFDNGGWHFCNLKSPQELLYKYKNLCETNDPYHFKDKIDKKYLDLNEIKQRVFKGEDIIGRNDTFKKVQIDNSFPEYILNNINIYKDWIKL